MTAGAHRPVFSPCPVGPNQPDRYGPITSEQLKVNAEIKSLQRPDGEVAKESAPTMHASAIRCGKAPPYQFGAWCCFVESNASKTELLRTLLVQVRCQTTRSFCRRMGVRNISRVSLRNYCWMDSHSFLLRLRQLPERGAGTLRNLVCSEPPSGLVCPVFVQ